MTYQPFRKFLMSCALVVATAIPAAAADDTEREGGVIGTGIVGEISELGSIVVNGQRITFEPDLGVRNSVAPKRADALLPGDVVAVAVTLSDQDWRAVAISEVHPLIGPVSDLGDDRFEVLGVTIMWTGARPSAGDWVAVSGFWAGDAVVATRVQPIAAQQKASIQGSYGLAHGGSPSMVGSLVLNIDPLQHAKEGDVVRVSGTLDGDLFTVTDVHLGLFDKPVSLVLAEGYLTNVAPSGHYTVAGSGLSAYTDDLQSIMSTDRITVCGINERLAQPQDLTDEILVERLGCPNPVN